MQTCIRTADQTRASFWPPSAIFMHTPPRLADQVWAAAYVLCRPTGPTLKYARRIEGPRISKALILQPFSLAARAGHPKLASPLRLKL